MQLALRLLLVVGLGIWASALSGLAGLPGVQRWEGALYDIRLALVNAMFPQRVQMDPRVLVIGVEPECYRSLGKHPIFWLPEYFEVSRAALEHGALAVGLDFLPSYAQPGDHIPLARLIQDFGQRLVMIAYWDSESDVAVPPDSLVAALGADNLALANLSLDQDAVARIQSIQNERTRETLGLTSWPFLAAALVERARQQPLPLEWATAGGGRTYVNLSATGPRKVPFRKVLERVRSGDSRSLQSLFRESLVLIGSLSKVDQDIVTTPNPSWKPGQFFTRSGFGVEQQAQLVNTLWTGQILRPLPDWKCALLLLAFLALLLAAARWASLGLNLFLLSSSLLAWLLLALLAMATWNLLIPLTPGLLGLPFSWALAMAWRSWHEGRARRRLQQTIAGYVAPEILQEMLAEPQTWLRSLNQRREVTILFSDINRFSSVSEQHPPEKVATWLNQHYQEMARVIFDHQGTIIRFVGDQFMVLFGSPKSIDRPESQAVACALAMHRRLEELQQQYGEGFFEIKIGIHRGNLLLAVIGDDLKRDYTAIGDEANLAARIQDLCKTVGKATLVSQEIVDRLPATAFVLHDEGEWDVKGRRQKVRVFSVAEQN